MLDLPESFICLSLHVLLLVTYASLLYFALAAQMWCFCRMLPFMIGHLIPTGDEHWVNFLRLLEIIDLLMAPCITHQLITYLGDLIKEHHEEFTRLYPSCSITPKFHFMIHYAEWIRRYYAQHLKYMYINKLTLF